MSEFWHWCSISVPVAEMKLIKFHDTCGFINLIVIAMVIKYVKFGIVIEIGLNLTTQRNLGACDPETFGKFKPA